jgi:hypothetical protein
VGEGTHWGRLKRNSKKKGSWEAKARRKGRKEGMVGREKSEEKSEYRERNILNAG